MENSLGWQKVVEDLAGDEHVTRAELKEVTLWFPSLLMTRNHAHSLVKSMTDDEKARAFTKEGESSSEEEYEVTVIFNDEQEVHMFAPVVDAEGDKDLPIDVEALPDMPDIVKMEV
ncbi:hypothetical protein ZWY2020_020076 [Hordeum vulgare]|nr:hypothetical protein ZWY2020_020076 [Hordeum vulgare]